MSSYNDARLDERFKNLEEDVHQLREELRVFAPHTLQIGVVEHRLDSIEQDVAELKSDVRTFGDQITDLLRSSRADTMKLVLVIIVPLIALILGGFATGRV